MQLNSNNAMHLIPDGTAGREETDHLSMLLQCNIIQLRELITKHHPLISQHINFICLIKFFNHYKIFVSDEMHHLQNNELSDERKTNSLIGWLSKKDEEGVRNFLKSLNDAKEHSGHSAILKKMSEKLCNNQLK